MVWYSRNPHKRTCLYENLEADFIFLNPVNKKSLEVETWKCSYSIGFLFSDFLRIFKNSWHFDQSSSVLQKPVRFLNKDSNHDDVLKNSSEFLY